jgi:hypothetical protein
MLKFRLVQIKNGAFMNMKKQLQLVDDIPMDNPGAVKKKPEIENCLTEILNEVFFERKLTEAKVARDTDIPFTTLNDWLNGRVQKQTLGKNIPKLARYLNLSIEYMVYGIGSDDPIYKQEGDKSGT